MSIAFSETTNNTGIVQQVRKFMRVDSTQWPTANIVNSVNNYLDTVTGYAIGADSLFQLIKQTTHSSQTNKVTLSSTSLVLTY
jgi:hypothetical protein